MGEKQALPRGQIIGGQSIVPVSYDIGDGNQAPVPRPVDEEAEGRISGQVSVLDERDLLEDGIGGVLFRDRDLSHTTLEGGDEESMVEIVPLGALAEPAGAVVAVDVGRGVGELEGDEVGDGYGREEEEEEQSSGGAQGHDN